MAAAAPAHTTSAASHSYDRCGWWDDCYDNGYGYGYDNGYGYGYANGYGYDNGYGYANGYGGVAIVVVGVPGGYGGYGGY